MIVHEANQETETANPNTLSSQMADQVAEKVFSAQTEESTSSSGTVGQELEDIGAQCFKESLK
ncbi:MAG: hypothetical protein Q4C95_12225 [Planctomycetia bacterium]|nr:hypothetical protein [Planctomycetia bacterium]